MKKTDIIMIILIAAVSAGLAYVLANSIFGGIGQENAKVKTVDAIQSTIQEPSADVFNENAINPAVEVQVENTKQEAPDTDTDTDTTDQTDDTQPDGEETPQGV